MSPVAPARGRDGQADPYDARIAVTACGALRGFNQAGVLSAADVHVARRLGRLGGEADERVLLAAALTVRAARLGSVCVPLAEVRGTVSVEGDEAGTDLSALPWPEPDAWLAACAASPLVAVGPEDPVGQTGPGSTAWRPLRLVEGLCYLDRYWRQEELVRTELDERASRPGPAVDPERLRAALTRLFPAAGPDRQRLAAVTAASRLVTVLAGGPGTGKTTTVARLLAVLLDQPGPHPRIALAAPTGKAAARLQEAVREEAAARGLPLRDVTASTLHRLLGFRPGNRSRFLHDRHNRLPFDVVVVDETSMVSLTMMSRLIEAVRADARLVLVGDPDQLASVEAGAVLGDLVARLAPAVLAGSAAPAEDAAAGSAPSTVPALVTTLAAADLDPGEAGSDSLRSGVVRLRTIHRFGGAIGKLAAAVQAGDPDEALALLHSGAADIEFVAGDASAPAAGALGALRAEVVDTGTRLATAAHAGEVDRALQTLSRHRLLCAHRRGPYGVSRWSQEVERWLAATPGWPVGEGLWYRGRPLLVTSNDYELRLYNGDTGVVVDGGTRGVGGVLAAFSRGNEPVLLSPSRLSAIQTMYAMTVHRSQGSQFDSVSLVLPPAESPLLTRELFYTAVTRATRHVRVLGTDDAVRAAVTQPIVRASGLRRGRSSVHPGGRPSDSPGA